MPKLINTYKANSFHLAEGELYFFGKDFHCYSPRENLGRLNHSTCNISHIKNFIFYDDAHGAIKIYDKHTDKLIFKHDPHETKISIGPRPILVGNNQIHVSIREGRRKSFGLFDLSHFTVKMVSFDCTFGPLNSGLVIDRIADDNWRFFLCAIDPVSSEEVWRFSDFLNLGIDQYDNQMIEEVELILGIADELLWIKLKYGRLVGLDVATGLCKKEVRTTDIDTTDFSRNGNECDGPPWNSPVFLEEESGIVSLSYSRYAEIDLMSEKPVWICFDVKQEFDEKGLYAGGIKTHHQGNIYFSESMSGVFGVFDRSSKKIVWSDDLKNHNPDAGMVFEMRATDTNLYIQDNKQNLYVFEHEDNGRTL